MSTEDSSGASLPLIPGRRWRWNPYRQPEFARFGEEWVILGNAEHLPLGEMVSIARRAPGRAPVWVRLNEVVAERTVRHAEDGAARYVMVRFENEQVPEGERKESTMQAQDDCPIHGPDCDGSVCVW